MGIFDLLFGLPDLLFGIFDHLIGMYGLVCMVCLSGPPQLMMAFTQDGQLNPDDVRRRDQEQGKDTIEVCLSACL
jgi:hypothetical protein